MAHCSDLGSQNSSIRCAPLGQDWDRALSRHCRRHLRYCSGHDNQGSLQGRGQSSAEALDAASTLWTTLRSNGSTGSTNTTRWARSEIPHEQRLKPTSHLPGNRPTRQRSFYYSASDKPSVFEVAFGGSGEVVLNSHLKNSKGRCPSISVMRLAIPQLDLLTERDGAVAEWSKAHAWKVCRRGTVSRVRIPLAPPPTPISVSAVFLSLFSPVFPGGWAMPSATETTVIP